jgi:hypothetical protein
MTRSGCWNASARRSVNDTSSLIIVHCSMNTSGPWTGRSGMRTSTKCRRTSMRSGSGQRDGPAAAIGLAGGPHRWACPLDITSG